MRPQSTLVCQHIDLFGWWPSSLLSLSRQSLSVRAMRVTPIPETRVSHVSSASPIIACGQMDPDLFITWVLLSASAASGDEDGTVESEMSLLIPNQCNKRVT